MPSVSKFHLLFCEHTVKMCENSRSITLCDIKLQLGEIEECIGSVWKPGFVKSEINTVVCRTVHSSTVCYLNG